MKTLGNMTWQIIIQAYLVGSNKYSNWYMLLLVSITLVNLR